MWTPIKIDNGCSLVKYCKTDSVRTIQVTDLMHLWYEDISEFDLLERCKAENSFLEATDEVLLGHIFTLLTSRDSDIYRTYSGQGFQKRLDLETSRDGFRFKMYFNFLPATHCQFYREVTISLLTTLSEFEKRQTMLASMLKLKDLEILEYKLEGGKISRKAVETQPFNLEAFSMQCADGISVTKNEVAAFPFRVLTPYVQGVMDLIENAPQEPMTIDQPNIKLEPQENKKTKLVRKFIHIKKAQMYDDEDTESEDNAVNQAGSSQVD